MATMDVMFAWYCVRNRNWTLKRLVNQNVVLTAAKYIQYFSVSRKENGTKKKKNRLTNNIEEVLAETNI